MREELSGPVKAKAIVHGRVTLSSGREADYYVDLRGRRATERGASTIFVIGMVAVLFAVNWCLTHG